MPGSNATASEWSICLRPAADRTVFGANTVAAGYALEPWRALYASWHRVWGPTLLIASNPSRRSLAPSCASMPFCARVHGAKIRRGDRPAGVRASPPARACSAILRADIACDHCSTDKFRDSVPDRGLDSGNAGARQIAHGLAGLRVVGGGRRVKFETVGRPNSCRGMIKT